MDYRNSYPRQKKRISCLEQSRMWCSERLDPKNLIIGCLESWPKRLRAFWGYYSRNKAKKLRKRESSFLLRRWFYTQNDWIGVLVVPTQLFTAQDKTGRFRMGTPVPCIVGNAVFTWRSQGVYRFYELRFVLVNVCRTQLQVNSYCSGSLSPQMRYGCCKVHAIVW